MKSVKHYFLNNVLLHIPSRRCRWFVYSKFFKSLGVNSSLLMGITVLKPENIIIGRNSVVNNGVLLDGRGGNLIIGENVDIAIDVKVWTLQHDINSHQHTTIGKDVIIEQNVWIASNAIILPGITIGEGAVVAAGAVVTKDVAPYTVVAGVPAKMVSRRTEDLNYTLNYRPFLR